MAFPSRKIPVTKRAMVNRLASSKIALVVRGLTRFMTTSFSGCIGILFCFGKNEWESSRLLAPSLLRHQSLVFLLIHAGRVIHVSVRFHVQSHIEMSFATHISIGADELLIEWC